MANKSAFIISGKGPDIKLKQKKIHYLIYTDNKDDLEIYPAVRAACNTFKKTLEDILKSESSLSSISIKENYRHYYKYNNNRYNNADYNFRFLIMHDDEKHIITIKGIDLYNLIYKIIKKHSNKNIVKASMSRLVLNMKCSCFGFRKSPIIYEKCHKYINNRLKFIDENKEDYVIEIVHG